MMRIEKLWSTSIKSYAERISIEPINSVAVYWFNSQVDVVTFLTFLLYIIAIEP